MSKIKEAMKDPNLESKIVKVIKYIEDISESDAEVSAIIITVTTALLVSALEEEMK